MHLAVSVISAVISATSLTITDPVEGEAYRTGSLFLKVIVENDNRVPDSVCFSLNETPQVPIPRLSTDWPTYMQNYRNTGYSMSPAPSTPEVLWTAPICSETHDFPTPAVVNGTVYYPQDGYGTGDTLFALDAATGEVRWTHRVGYTDDTITYYRGLLYSSSDSLFCIDAATGEDVWHFCPEDELYPTGSPVVTDGVVYFLTTALSTDTTVVHAADSETGELIWTRSFAAPMESSTAWEDGVLYIPLYTYGLHGDAAISLFALDGTDGSTIWSSDHCEGGYWDSSPCIVEDLIYIGGNDGFLHAFDKNGGTLVWQTLHHPDTVWSEPTPAYNNSRVFTGCCNWQQQNYVGAFDSKTGIQLWNWTDRIGLHGSFGLAEGLAFMGATYMDTIYAFDQITGEVVWSFGIDAPKSGPEGWDGFQSSPSITDGIMYLPSTDGNLYALGSGMQFTYSDEIEIGWGVYSLAVTSYEGGNAVAADTVDFAVSRWAAKDSNGAPEEPHGVIEYMRHLIQSIRLSGQFNGSKTYCILC